MRTKLFVIVGLVSLSLMGCSGGAEVSASATPVPAATAPATP